MSGFFSDTRKIMSWSVLGQLVGVISYPVISRIFEASEVGAYGVYIAIFSLISSVSTLRIEMSIAISKNSVDLNNNVNLASLLNIVLSFLSFIFIFVLFEFFNVELNPVYILLTVFLFGLNRISNMVCIYRGDFDLIGKAKFIQISSLVFLQLVLGLLYPDVVVLMIANILGYLLSFFYYMMKVDSIFFFSKIDNIKSSLLSKKDYIRYDTPAILANTLNNELYSLVFPFLFGLTTGGHYILAYRILIIPVSFVGSTLGQVLLSYSKLWSKTNDLYKNLKIVFLVLLLISIIAVSICLLFIEPIFNFILGEGWSNTSRIMSLLCISSFAQFFYSPFSTLIQFLSMQKFNFQFFICFVLTKFILVFIFHFYGVNIFDGVLITSIISFFYYLFFVVNVLVNAKNKDFLL